MKNNNYVSDKSMLANFEKDIDKKDDENFTDIKAMIFDMDGTVLDSNILDFEAWRDTFKEHGVDLKYEDYIKLLGAKSSEIVKIYLGLSEVETEDFIQRREACFRDKVKHKGLLPIPYIEDLLKQIKGIPMKIALATGAQKDKLDYIFERINLRDYFDAIVTADEVRSGKPDPEIFLKAAKRLGVYPNEAIVWEDAERGIKAARDGGFYCVAITTTQGRNGLGLADLIIDSYKGIDVKEILHQFSKESYVK